MEKKLGRPLTQDECVDHIDRNPENNSPDNLRLFSTHGEHTKVAHADIFISQSIVRKGIHFSPKTEFKKGDPRIMGNKFRLGISSWNKGKKWSLKHREKLKGAHKGKHKPNLTSFKKGMIPWNKGLKKT